MKIRPLNRSITLVCVLFFALLSIVLSVTTYKLYTRTMLNRYQKQMSSVLSYVDKHIDHDDMSTCAQTNVESTTYKKFQAFLDNLVDNYADVHYIYIMRILESGDTPRAREICSANSSYEKEHEPELVLRLGDVEEGLSPQTEERFYEIQMGDDDVYLKNPSKWGIDYTLARPLVDSKGTHYGMLCVDVAIDDLDDQAYKDVYIHIAVIVAAGLVFTALLLLWMRLNVTNPIKELEESVDVFARTSAGKKNPNELVYYPPKLKVHNEVRLLANAMVKLSEDMRNYVKEMLKAENESRDLQAKAYRDALTGVKNKAAYDDMRKALEQDILDGTAEFGIVMVDLNFLKATNDQYGHEHGNEYIMGTCRMICQIFKHSPVYRVGGDEFVVVLQRDDYNDREKLCSDLKVAFSSSARRTGADAWRRYSAAVGMAAYEDGDTVDAVFSRADQDMYRAKADMKAGR